MTSPTDHGLEPVRRSVGTLSAALRCKEAALVASTVLALRVDLHNLAQNTGITSGDRFARLSQGLRQIDRAARAGDFAQARLALTQWHAAL